MRSWFRLTETAYNENEKKRNAALRAWMFYRFYCATALKVSSRGSSAQLTWKFNNNSLTGSCSCIRLCARVLARNCVHLYYCVCVCTEKSTPPDWEGPARGGRDSQPHGRVGAASRAGAVWKVGGGASSSSQGYEGNSGRMGRILPAGHQPTHPASVVVVSLQMWGRWCCPNKTLVVNLKGRFTQK